MESFDAFYENNGCGIILHRGINVIEERSWILKEVRKKLLKSNNRLDSFVSSRCWIKGSVDDFQRNTDAKRTQLEEDLIVAFNIYECSLGSLLLQMPLSWPMEGIPCFT